MEFRDEALRQRKIVPLDSGESEYCDTTGYIQDKGMVLVLWRSNIIIRAIQGQVWKKDIRSD